MSAEDIMIVWLSLGLLSVSINMLLPQELRFKPSESILWFFILLVLFPVGVFSLLACVFIDENAEDIIKILTKERSFLRRSK